MFETVNPFILVSAFCCLGPVVLFGSGWFAHAWALRVRRRYRIVDLKRQRESRGDVGYAS